MFSSLPVRLRTLIAGICLILLFASFVCAEPERPRYEFLTPLVEMENARARVVHLTDLKTSLTREIDRDGAADSVAIYVEDLHSGTQIGINERVPVHLASLLKIALMISWLRVDEAEPGTLEKILVVDTVDVIVANDIIALGIDSPLRAGRYSVRDLIETMIVLSDNRAAHALTDGIDKDSVIETFIDLGLPHPFEVDPRRDPYFRAGAPMTAKRYSNILKALYNASYLDESRSQMALEFLARTKFSGGIRKILPGGTIAALKYGIFAGAFYESGIVYLSGNPYLVTIFVARMRSNDHSDQLELIRRYAAIIHRHFEKIPRESPRRSGV